MYERFITRKNPGCIIFLLDRSDSMKLSWDGSQTLAEGAARAINDVLRELCLRAKKERGVTRHYFDIGIFGYGMRPVAGGEGVESGFGGALAGRTLVALPELQDNPVAVREVPSVDRGAPADIAPVWVEPMHGCRTPMCEAISAAGNYAYEWTLSHLESFPPIVINITDGMVTDDPFEGASLGEWAQRLTSVATQDGPALLFNIFLSPNSAGRGRVLFPATADGLPVPGPDLFKISSVLPPPMVANSGRAEIAVPAGGRGFGFNADSAMLVRFLHIGTRVDTRD
jgi:hypothetical protein